MGAFDHPFARVYLGATNLPTDGNTAFSYGAGAGLRPHSSDWTFPIEARFLFGKAKVDSTPYEGELGVTGAPADEFNKCGPNNTVCDKSSQARGELVARQNKAIGRKFEIGPQEFIGYSWGREPVAGVNGQADLGTTFGVGLNGQLKFTYFNIGLDVPVLTFMTAKAPGEVSDSKNSVGQTYKSLFNGAWLLSATYKF